MAVLTSAGAHVDRYEPNPKHKEPWQSGRRGALCPRDADGPTLLDASTPDPSNTNVRWATDGSRFFTAKSSRHENVNGDLFWHGYPVDHLDVPADVMKAWIAAGLVSRRTARRGGT